MTVYYAVAVYDAVYDEDHSAKRKKGWEEMPHGTTPLKVSGWYPPGGVPSPSFADVIHDERLEVCDVMISNIMVDIVTHE